MNNLKFGVINLGCDKNRIDAEIIINTLKEKYELVLNAEEADILLINTCGFIEKSKQESINTILEMSEYKEGNCKVLMATGCLTQRYGKELMDLIPELDIILGVNDYDKIFESIDKVINSGDKTCLVNYSDTNINTGKRVVTTGEATAYIRISEGCNNICAYCAIPKIRGRYRSRAMEDIVKEAKELALNGYKELIIVAQDTTNYGVDLYGKKTLHLLLQELGRIKSIKWIRLLYCYAEELTDDIINEIAVNDKVCKYIDIPLQHISDSVLKSMKRKGRKKIICENIGKLRERVPGIAIRTTFIVGFPGETEEDFKELMDFVKDTRFDKLGVFTYSQEEGTAAALMKDQVDEDIKEKRFDAIMTEQQKISLAINKNIIGEEFEVLIEGRKKGYFYGRSSQMAPEIDGEVLVKGEDMMPGQFVKVKVTEAMQYDLIAQKL